MAESVPAPYREDARRKNFVLDQTLLDRVRSALGARTEREAVVRATNIALDHVEFGREVIR